MSTTDCHTRCLDKKLLREREQKGYKHVHRKCCIVLYILPAIGSMVSRPLGERPDNAELAEEKCMLLRRALVPLTPRPGCGILRTWREPPTGSSCSAVKANTHTIHSLHIHTHIHYRSGINAVKLKWVEVYNHTCTVKNATHYKRILF